MFAKPQLHNKFNAVAATAAFRHSFPKVGRQETTQLSTHSAKSDVMSTYGQPTAPYMRLHETGDKVVMGADIVLLIVVAFGFATMCFIGKNLERLLTDIRDELRKRP